LPINKEVYEPILKELEKYGVQFNEKIVIWFIRTFAYKNFTTNFTNFHKFIKRLNLISWIFKSYDLKFV
jgi:hypothetical protein